jgi:hypothetical protein
MHITAFITLILLAILHWDCILPWLGGRAVRSGLMLFHELVSDWSLAAVVLEMGYTSAAD